MSLGYASGEVSYAPVDDTTPVCTWAELLDSVGYFFKDRKVGEVHVDRERKGKGVKITVVHCIHV